MAASRRRPELGQHYLRRETAARLVRLSGVTARDLVVEIGAGRGALTGYLATRARRVIAVELDPILASKLRRQFSDEPRVEVVEGDFLTVPLPSEDFVVVSNIPFGDTARIVARTVSGNPRAAWLVVQREAAERDAGHSWSSGTLQSLLLKPRWEIEVRGYPRRTDFDPPPSVDTAVLCFRRRSGRSSAVPSMSGSSKRASAVGQPSGNVCGMRCRRLRYAGSPAT